MPCPRVKRPHDGQQIATTGKTVLMRDKERVQQAKPTRQKPQQEAPGEAQAAPEPLAVSEPPRLNWPHVGCAPKGKMKDRQGLWRQPSGLPRLECSACGETWHRHGDGRWERV